MPETSLVKIMAEHRDLVLQLEAQDFRVDDPRVLHAAMGICTEGGEILDAVKKHGYTRAPVDRTNVIEELGDLLWYVQLLMDAMGLSLGDILEPNIKKLRKRYEEGFSAKDALVRNLDAERKALEGLTDGEEG